MDFKLVFDKSKLPKDVVQAKFTDDKEIKFLKDENKIDKLLIGICKNRSEVSLRDFFILCRKLVRVAKIHRIKKLAIGFEEFDFPKLKNFSDEEKSRTVSEQFLIAGFDFLKYKSEKESFLDEVFILNFPKECKSDFEKGIIVGKEVNRCRELANTPGGDMTPALLAQKAKNACRGTAVKVSVFDEKKIKELKMGAILGVSRGSPEKPKFIVMEYWGSSSKDSRQSKHPIVLVGKGVTFDTGGLSLKSSDSMLGMHLDMSGGAAVIHAIAAAAKLGLKKDIIGLVPAVENMPSGESYRPGDILKTMSGKTVEVLNTDAEGRLILADALTFAKRYKPKLVIDIATLTGAAVVALGERCSAIFSKDKKIINLLEESGEKVGEYVWPLPLWEEYEEDIKGHFADFSNIHKDNSRWGGAIEAAVFLYQFAKDYPLAHIDMAPRMVSIKSDHLARGATGEPLKLLVRLIESQ